MSTRPRRLLLTLSLAIAVAACSSSGSTPSSAAPAEPSSPAASAPADSQAPSGSAPAAGQTDTDWGRIWDAVPAAFPRFPGATPADEMTGEPASARYTVSGGDPEAVAAWMQGALETATFSTIALNGPAEDGGFVIDFVGDGACRIETRIAPLGDLTVVTVRYGAECPA